MGDLSRCPGADRGKNLVRPYTSDREGHRRMDSTGRRLKPRETTPEGTPWRDATECADRDPEFMPSGRDSGPRVADGQRMVTTARHSYSWRGQKPRWREYSTPLHAEAHQVWSVRSG